MESSPKYTLVGVVVVVLSIFFFSSIIWLGGGGSSKAASGYTVYFRKHSLSGLQIDSYVTMKGIVVGSVKDFVISPTDIERVKVSIEVNADIPVKTDTSAVITRNLLTGLAAVELKGGTGGSSFLKDIPLGESFPIVQEGETELDAIANSVPGLIDDFGQILQEAKGVISEENRKSLTGTLNNLEVFSASLASMDAETKKLVANLSEVSANMVEVTKAARKTFDSAGKNLPAMLEEMKIVLENVGSTSKTVDRESEKLAKSFRSAIDLLVVDVNNVSKDISRAAQSVTAAMEQFDDPSSLLTGPSEGALGPGERIKE